MTREYTNKLMELVEEGVLTSDGIFKEFMSYLSEAEVKELCLEGFGGELRIEGLFKDLDGGD